MELTMFWAQELKQYQPSKRIPVAIKKIKSFKDLIKLLTILKIYIKYKMKSRVHMLSRAIKGYEDEDSRANRR